MIVYLLVAIIFVLIGVIVFLSLLYQNERQKLLDRIMAVDYRTYSLSQEKVKDKELESISSLNDEEEAKLELDRLESEGG